MIRHLMKSTNSKQQFDDSRVYLSVKILLLNLPSLLLCGVIVLYIPKLSRNDSV